MTIGKNLQLVPREREREREERIDDTINFICCYLGEQKFTSEASSVAGHFIGSAIDNRKYSRHVRESSKVSIINKCLFHVPFSLLYWTVPFLCWMAIVILLGAMTITYYISVRYIILIYGKLVFPGIICYVLKLSINMN